MNRPTRKPIDLSSSPLDALLLMAESNPGAATVLAKLVEDDSGFLDVLHLDDMNMRGPQIWVAFKNHCGCDIAKLREAIRSRDPAMIETVNRIAEPQIGVRAIRGSAWEAPTTTEEKERERENSREPYRP